MEGGRPDQRHTERAHVWNKGDQAKRDSEYDEDQLACRNWDVGVGRKNFGGVSQWYFFPMWGKRRREIVCQDNKLSYRGWIEEGI